MHDTGFYMSPRVKYENKDANVPPAEEYCMVWYHVHRT